ncbi:expressed unknown protein [Seminavis robusta]|uniref:Uncharacterized protein n=1 Tax=Seminavis robusta TaxID=568900 RepID=A0A9N8DZZ9_9STRA|nr:expressed unknown protein [Seminavis robusta]|eukprot:Sro489_g153230.1 n/a (577) ;mRNA; r:12388-14316
MPNDNATTTSSPATMVTAKQEGAPAATGGAPEAAVDNSADDSSPSDGDDEASPVKLYKSNRLKGYITLILAGIINYTAARNSQKVVNNHAVAASDGQRAYAEAVAITSVLMTSVIFVAHLDRWSPLKSVWEKTFGDGSVIELLMIIFLVIWWTIATSIATTVRGIAGDGKGQYNLYYSTWCCCWTSYWTLERWLVAYGWASFKQFISSWPFRAPGWIAVGIFSFLCLMWYMDLYSNHESATRDAPLLQQHYLEIGDGQWEWLLFVGSATLVPSLVFVIVELFRETSTDATSSSLHGGSTKATPDKRFSVAAAAHHRVNAAVGTRNFSPSRDSPIRSSRQFVPQRQNPLPDKGNSTGGKGPLENILEGFCLVLLVLAWIPTVIISTSPGGAASLVGNAYFCTWINTVFIMETFIWFLHDLRKGVHSALQVKEREYQKRQQEVMQKSRALEGKRMAAGSWQNDAVDDIELDEVQPTPTMQAVMPPLPTHPVFDLSSSQTPPPQEERLAATSPNVASNDTYRRGNVRLRGTDLDDDLDDVGEDDLPGDDDNNERTPRGSTVFFEADMAPSNRDLENPMK